MGHHLRWSRLLLQGRFDETDTLLDALGPTDYPYRELLLAITAAERGDDETAVRLTADIETAGIWYPRPVSPIWLRLRAQAAAASADPQRCDDARAALAPHTGRVDGGALRLRRQRPGRPLARTSSTPRSNAGTTPSPASRPPVTSADRLGSRPWSLIARAGLVTPSPPGATRATPRPWPSCAPPPPSRRHSRYDAGAAPARRTGPHQAPSRPPPHPRSSRRPGRRATRPRAGSAVAPAAAAGPGQATAVAPAIEGYEFRRDGPVWQLAYAGVVVHLPDAKGLHDLHLLLSRPGSDVPAVELLDPAAGPELVAARRMGGDPVLDDEAKARYRRHLARLDEEIDRAPRARRPEGGRVGRRARCVARRATCRSGAGRAEPPPGRRGRAGPQDGDRANQGHAAQTRRAAPSARRPPARRRLDRQHLPLPAARAAALAALNARWTPASTRWSTARPRVRLSP